MRKISLKTLSMEMKTQPTPANAQLNPNHYNPNQGTYNKLSVAHFAIIAWMAIFVL
jgi:hypothetical protein